ncbi:hypothetical protein [Thalassotalea profundi]|uniref:DUF4488 domain-containing protein n=1 Tax=Thalassotalea profundi TaxID=2036687 RepID=A0ABQ3IUL0_9GAMM|nr:hypothetical protein [Thalassotalea profundi]GHE91578.1 hypothetical protein GCM10011501_21200 [Thalassotalea profundi]
MSLTVKTAFTLVIVWLLISPRTALADKFIGQWHIIKNNKLTTAQTIDGLNKLQITVNTQQDVSIILTLHNFSGFGTKHEVFEYQSPTYGNVRTVDYYIKEDQITLSTPYEVNRFIENLKDIATHALILDDTLGSSFKERKINISYLSTEKKHILNRAAFSTIEIDEVLQSLGL